MVWYPRHKPKLKENFTGVMYTFIQSAIRNHSGLWLILLGRIVTIVHICNKGFVSIHDILKIPVFSYDMITEIVEARLSISYRFTLHTLKFGQKREKFNVFDQKRKPITLQTDSGLPFRTGQLSYKVMHLSKWGSSGPFVNTGTCLSWYFEQISIEDTYRVSKQRIDDMFRTEFGNDAHL